MKCPDCASDATEYVAEASSEICTICGTVVQSSGDTLADLAESQTYDEGRAAVNETIFSGESTKGHYGRVKASSCHVTLQRLCSSLQCSSLASRACNIFDNVIRVGQIRYGPLSKLVIGASAAIAVRESVGRDCLAEIAVRLGVKKAPLIKMFAKAKSILDISSPSNDPTLYFPTLLRKVSDLSSQADTPLSPKLNNYLDSVQFAAVSKLAVSLAALTKDVSLHQNRATPAVACAYIIMAFEGELGNAMPGHVELIRQLGLHVGFHKVTIEERYRELSRLVTDWRGHLPWADRIPKQGVAARDANARYVKDVVAFQMQLKAKALKSLQGRNSNASDDGSLFEGSEADASKDDESGEFDDLERCTLSTDALAGSRFSSPRSTTKRRLSTSGRGHSLSTTAEGTDDDMYLSNSGRPDAYVHRMKRPGVARKEAIHRAASSLLAFIPGVEESFDSDLGPSAGDLRRAVLRHPSFATELSPASRLTALRISRGGEEHIDDEELFSDGEFESYLRDDDERSALETAWAFQDQVYDERPTSATNFPEKTKTDLINRAAQDHHGY